MRSEGYCSCLCVCVCVSVNRHLTSGASVRPENAVTYSAGNEGQKICGVYSETAPLPTSSTPSVVRPCLLSAIFLVYAHAYFSCLYAHDTQPRVQHFSAFHWSWTCTRYDTGPVLSTTIPLSHLGPSRTLRTSTASPTSNSLSLLRAS